MQLRLPNIEPPKQVKPAPDRPEPMVWVRELLVLRELKEGDEFVQRRISLRRGLNILWSKPFSDGQAPGKLFDSGLSGHAAGKTTFCRLLRYILGEPSFGDESLRTAIRGKLPQGWVVAEVMIQGEPWLVGRPLGIGPHPFACQGLTIEGLFRDDLEKGEFSKYMEALEEANVKPLPVKSLVSSNEPVEWSHLLPWLTRDQECRFSKMLEWRDPSSESQAPHLDVGDRQYLVRAVLQLVSDEEHGAAVEHVRLLNERKDAKERRPSLEYRAKAIHQDLEEAFKCELPPLDDDLFGQTAGKKLSERQGAQESDGTQEDIATEVDRAQDALTQAIETEVAASRDLQDVRDRLQVEQARLMAISEDMTQEQRRDLFASLPPAKGYCNVPIEVAKAEGCPLAQERPLDLGIVRTQKELDEQKGEQEKRVKSIEESARKQETELTRQSQAVQQARRRLFELRTSYRERVSKTARQQAENDRLRVLVEKAQTAWSDHGDLNKSIEEFDQRIQESLDELATHRDLHDQALGEFSSVFDYVVRAVLGDEVAASVVFSGSAVDLKIEYKGERKSAAIETIKLICFDLAVLTASIQGTNLHPRFLLHDGPREADMAPNVYQRFFQFAEALEGCFDEDAEPNFQYIITTTEMPPDDLRKSPWLIEPVLDASEPEKRLLGVDL